MLHFLAEYGLFFAKIATMVIAILIVLGFIASLASQKDKLKESLKIKKLNDTFNDLKKKMQEAIFTKKELKQQAKVAKKKDKKKNKKSAKAHDRKRVFVLNFKGDIKAAAVENLRQEITAIIKIADKNDEVVACIESPGGMIHSYGLAASQLHRLREHNIPLTAIVDKVAASGGYLMASVANKICAAPFAIVGSIGVVAQIPNFHKLLKKHNIDYEQITAGDYKRTLSMFGENTNKGRKKFQEEIDEAHTLFKHFVGNNRPSLDIEKIATGEHWYGTQALELGLIDTITTSDDYLLKASEKADLFQISYVIKKKWNNKIAHAVKAGINDAWPFA